MLFNILICVLFICLTTAALEQRQDAENEIEPVSQDDPGLAASDDPGDPDNSDIWTFNDSSLPDLSGNNDKQAPIKVTLADLDGKNPQTVEFNVPASMSMPDLKTTDQPKPEEPEEPKEPEDKKEELRCTEPHSAAGAYIDKANMEAHANDFCDNKANGVDKPDLHEPYGEDTYAGVIIHLKSDVTIDSDTCKERLNRIINDCVPAEDNPRNWKYGGEFENGGTLYKINIFGQRSTRREHDGDTPMRDPEAECALLFHTLYVEFTIVGSGWVNADYGEALKGNISACRNGVGAALSEWEFGYHEDPTDPAVGKWEWGARGHVILGGDNCLSPAIEGAGGPSDLPCNGP